MSGQLIRAKYMRQFTGLERYSKVRARFVVFSYLAQIVLSVTAGHIALQQPMSLMTILLSIFFAVFTATRFRGLKNIVHECSHATFAKDRQENVFLGSICASTVLSSFHDYKDEHLTHHQHLGDYKHDMDLQGIEDLGLHDPLTMRTFLRHMITPLIGRHLPYYLGANLSSRDGLGFLMYKVGLIVSAIVVLFLMPVTALLMIIVPFGLIYSSLNYWTDCLDHAGLVASPDEIDASRNILAPLPVKLLLFPREDCYHLVHHLFPQVPARHLRSCHKVLQSDQTYQSKPHAVSFRKRLANKLAAIAHPAE